MKKRRIVVTGMGVVSCFGTDVELFYQKLLAGKSGVGPIQAFDCSEYPTRFAGEVRDFEVGEYMDKKQARRVDPFIRYTMVAGKKALEHAGFDLKDFKDLNLDRAGVIISSGMGGMSVFYEGVETLLTKGFKRLTPFFVPYIITNMGGALLAIDTGFRGPNFSISTACATANSSIHAAAQEIEMGRADLMLCGGAEASINPIGVSGFVSMGALSTRNDEPEKASRPWDKNRDGFVMGEGAGVLVLESLEHAQKRNAPILAELMGSFSNCDAYHITTPREDGGGVRLCMEGAIQNAQVDKTRVNYVNAHATATPVGDLCEIRALRSVFQEHCKNMKINATKSLIGHCLGAAGGLEAVATVQAIRTGMLHPTLNVEDPETEVEGLDLVLHQAKPHQVDVALSNSFGFGGHNVTLVFAPYKGS